MTDNPNHNEDGTFAPGNTAGGKAQRGRATWAARIAQLDDKYNTVDKLLALFVKGDDGKLGPGEDLRQMHPRDAALVMQMLGAIIGDDKLRERESFWDREEGKPLQRNEFAGPGGKELFHGDAVAARQTLIGRAIPLIAGSGEDGADKPADGSAGTGPSV